MKRSSDALDQAAKSTLLARKLLGGDNPALPKVVVCGGGAGGLVLAVRLARQGGYAVTLVDPQLTHIWKPLLHEFASGTAEASFHEVPYSALARRHGFAFAPGSLAAIDRDRKIIGIAAAFDVTGAELAPAREMSYDVLVIAVGGVSNDFGIPGVREHAYFLDHGVDAERLHRRIIQICMGANYGLTPEIGEHLDISIVGGGATGVELAAELRASTAELIGYGLDNLDPKDFIRLRVINGDPRLVAQLPERVSTSVEKALTGLGVEILNGEMVAEVGAGHVVTRSGKKLPADLTIWAAGIKAPDSLAGIAGLQTNKANQLVVTPTLQTTRDAAIFAIGDCAAAPWRGTQKHVPPRAQAAAQEARYVAQTLPRVLSGKEVKPFGYNDLGSLVSLGGENAIGTLMGWARGAGIRVEGFLAQLIYRYLYKRHQAVLFGWWPVVLDSLGRWASRATRPQIKLH